MNIPDKIKILIVEDELIIAKVLSQTLEEFGYQIVATISSGEDAIKQTALTSPDLILMDIMIKGEMDGIETAERIYKSYQIPILYLTAYADDETLERAEKTGAYGYLIKPFQERELHATIKLALNKHQEILTGHQYQLSTKQLPLGHKVNQVNYDSITHLPNRLTLREFFEDSLRNFSLKTESQNFSNSQSVIAIICLDLDRFNRINHTFGYVIGNSLLYRIAQRLTNCLKGQGKVIHFNADEFVIILDSIHNKKDTESMVQYLLNTIDSPLLLNQHQIHMTASAGIAFYPTDAQEIDTLVRQTNKAMKFAKQQGGNQYQIYKEKLHAVNHEYISLESDLHYALEREEFEVYYQPRVNLKTGKIVAAEALLRWHHPQRGLISPVVFIPLTEANGLIEPIGEWILEKACQQTKIWHNSGLGLIHIAVNLSGRQFKRQTLDQNLLATLLKVGLNPNCLEIELTESILVKNIDLTLERLNALKSLGVQIAIDDFGTGYSSLGYLQQFPFDILKIDRCFVRNIHQNTKNAAITTAIISLAHHLNLDVIAEGVEKHEELEFLARYQCTDVQGYLFSPPLPVAEFEILLKQGFFPLPWNLYSSSQLNEA